MRVRRQPHLTLDDHFRAVATGTPLRDGHETDRAGLTLVDACRALLAAAPSQPVADAIFSRVDRAGLVDAVAAMERLAPRRRTVRATSSSPGAVRRYLPLLLDTL